MSTKSSTDTRLSKENVEESSGDNLKSQLAKWFRQRCGGEVAEAVESLPGKYDTVNDIFDAIESSEDKCYIGGVLRYRCLLAARAKIIWRHLHFH
eukprot:UN09864